MATARKFTLNILMIGYFGYTAENVIFFKNCFYGCFYYINFDNHELFVRLILLYRLLVSCNTLIIICLDDCDDNYVNIVTMCNILL